MQYCINCATSLNNLIESKKYKDIKYGIKLGYKNIGFNGKFYTFPYFLAFFLISKEKEYKIEIKVSEDGILQYETKGCTLEEYIDNNEDVTVGVYNELGDFVVAASQLFGSKE